jgi:hypothetical protein
MRGLIAALHCGFFRVSFESFSGSMRRRLGGTEIAVPIRVVHHSLE